MQVESVLNVGWLVSWLVFWSALFCFFLLGFMGFEAFHDVFHVLSGWCLDVSL